MTLWLFLLLIAALFLLSALLGYSLIRKPTQLFCKNHSINQRIAKVKQITDGNQRHANDESLEKQLSYVGRVVENHAIKWGHQCDLEHCSYDIEGVILLQKIQGEANPKQLDSHVYRYANKATVISVVEVDKFLESIALFKTEHFLINNL